MLRTKIIKKLKSLLESHSENVSNLEYISDNYLDDGTLVEEKIPTITTEFCEIGFDGIKVYFNIIIFSKSFDKKLFDSLKDSQNLYVYGFTDFLINLFPKENFDFDEFVREIEKDEKLQFQFNFPDETAEEIIEKYFEIREIFRRNQVLVIDQNKIC